MINLPSSETGVDEPFHLNFDEHFQPFVDREISEFDREIVESHVKVCSFCASSLRDLQEFRHKLELREIVAGQNLPRFWEKIGIFFRQNFKPVAALSCGLLFAVALGFLLRLNFLKDKREEIIAQVSPTGSETPIYSENSAAKNENLQISVETDKNKNSNKVENSTQQPKDVEKNTDQLAGLPVAAREIVARTIKTEKLEIPIFLGLLAPGKGKLRGSNSGNQSNSVSPNKKVLQTTQPVFSWQQQNGAENYDLEIYDENFNLVKRSAKINKNNWQSDENLPRGKVLRWEVKANNQKSAEPIQNGTFYILDEKTAGEIVQIEKNKQVSSLARGIMYAKAGLFQKAETEFRKYLLESPHSKTTKLLLNQVLRLK